MTVDHLAAIDSEAALRVQIDEAGGALLKLRRDQPVLAGTLVALTQLVAEEAARTPRFARSLAAALATSDAPRTVAPASAAPPSRNGAPARRRKRAEGKIDPFAVFRVSDESGLREALNLLDVEELK
ncbi:MAG: hypothetical protein ICV72_06785, partial [Aldersonia sp.]|nr:hypothetical protein [Aldersonia sp.]